MFLHLGSDVSVALKDVIAINDYSYLKTINKEFLKNDKIFRELTTESTQIDTYEKTLKELIYET